MWCLPELVEAAERTGETDLARQALDRLAEVTLPAGTDFAIGILARSRALLSDDAKAEALYNEAVERLGRTQLRPELAGRFLYGEWLRRRVVASTHAISSAPLTSSLQRSAWRDSPARRRRSSWPPARKCASGSGDPLRTHATGASDRSAPARGLTNLEIGAQLYISARTVEWHLRKVFSKLDITSRRQLRTVLTEDAQFVAGNA